MDDDLKHLRVSFSGVRQGGETVPLPSQRRTSSRRASDAAEEYDAAYAATVAAVAYAIAAREERLSASQESTPYAAADRLARGNKQSSKSARTTKRGESLEKPNFEGRRSSSSRWFTGKEPIDDDYQDEQVKRPLRPAQKKPAPAEGAASDERLPALADPALRVRKDFSFTRKPSEKRGSRRFEQDQGNQTTAPPPPPPTARPSDKASSSYSAAGSRDSGAATTSGGPMAFSSENEAMADAWEKEKLARIKRKYNETMQTIAAWEAEKKANARRQKQLKDESESERKRAKALEEYTEEMSRINKVAAASRLTAEEKKRSAERKARDKAHTIRSTGKLPGACGCF
uniref:Remorin C-terminal domain-containing protein n=1 Tax=Zea mays TaxID=4577 RepID=A0A804U6Z0_MAIZE